jgi:hypothetical protein
MQLVACAAWEGGIDNIHYPEADMVNDSYPLAVLDETSQRRTLYAIGAGGLRSGSLRAVLHLDATTIGQAEATARTIGQQLMAQQTGFLFTDFQVGLCAEPKPQADLQVFAIELTLDYGPTA